MIARKPRKVPSINIIPLIDVLMVMVFFFMTTMQFRNEDVLNITPPKMETAGSEPESGWLTVAIRKDGTFLLGSEVVDREQLAVRLAELSKGGQQAQLIIKADEEVQLKFATEVMDMARKLNLEKVRLLTR